MWVHGTYELIKVNLVPFMDWQVATKRISGEYRHYWQQRNYVLTNMHLWVFMWMMPKAAVVKHCIL